MKEIFSTANVVLEVGRDCTKVETERPKLEREWTKVEIERRMFGRA
ncbi:MAG: hypothetical protein ACFWT6_10850 [Virgibacillus proomii]|jgi:hypothetical protein